MDKLFNYVLESNVKHHNVFRDDKLLFFKLYFHLIFDVMFVLIVLKSLLFTREPALLSFIFGVFCLYLIEIKKLFVIDISKYNYSYKTFSMLDLFNFGISDMIVLFAPGWFERAIDAAFFDREFLMTNEERSYLEFIESDFIEKGLSPEEFIKNNLDRNERTLINFFKQRMFNHKREIQNNFLFYSRIIPKANIMSVDSLKMILVNNQFPNDKSKLYIRNTSIFKIKYSLKYFSNYQEIDLKKLFTKKYDYQNYLDVLGLLIEHEVTIPVFDSIEEILEYLIELDVLSKDGGLELNQQIRYRGICEVLGEFNINDFKYSFHIMKNVADIYRWGKKLHNCLRTDSRRYKNLVINGDCILLGIYKENREYAVLAISPTGVVIEFKKKLNEELPWDESTQIINRFLTEYYYKTIRLKK